MTETGRNESEVKVDGDIYRCWNPRPGDGCSSQNILTYTHTHIHVLYANFLWSCDLTRRPAVYRNCFSNRCERGRGRGRERERLAAAMCSPATVRPWFGCLILDVRVALHRKGFSPDEPRPRSLCTGLWEVA